MKSQLHERVDNDFIYHAPDAEKIKAHASIRTELMNVAHSIVEACPEGRALSTALTKLEEVMFWANAAIARDG